MSREIKSQSNATSELAWLAAHLYYAEPWDHFLVHGIKPFVDAVFKDGWAEQFFFIRYWEHGPHIRLRFKGKSSVLDKAVKPQIQSFFSNYFQKYPSTRSQSIGVVSLGQHWFPNHSIQFIAYEPEVARYGGPKGIQIAESQFETSSRTILSLIAAGESWTYDRALGAAVQLHLAFACACGMDLYEAQYFFRYVSDKWFTETYRYTSCLTEQEAQERQQTTLTAFAQAFSQQRKYLVSYHQRLWHALTLEADFQQPWLNDWLRGTQLVYQKLDALREQGLLVLPPTLRTTISHLPVTRESLWPILESYVHMTNNRLGILNRDESYLGYLMSRCLEELQLAEEPLV